MYQRLFSINKDAKHSVFIFGPRGTGKTSWLKQNLGDALYFDLLDDDIYRDFLARPTLLGERIPDNYEKWIIIDEIQRAPQLLNEVHRLIEHKNYRFILTGSSARGLRRKGVNLLAGRALIHTMHPLTSIELGNDFQLKTSLQLGHLPAVIHHDSPMQYLTSYVKTYLREEVLQESLTRNIALFTRFLEVASFSQGEVINYTNIAREIGSNRHTINNYFDILEDLLIAYRLPVFTKHAKREVITKPKFFYFDVGIYRTIRPKGPLDSPADIDGPALETLFLQEAKAINDYEQLEYDFYYWRTRSKLEVDIILYGNKGFHAFEIKRKSKLTSKDFNGLLQFGKDYPEATLHLLYGGTNTYHEKNVHIRPFENAITDLRDILLCDLSKDAL